MRVGVICSFALVLAGCAHDGARGVIEGRVTLGPLEPVCRMDRPCSDGPYAGARIVVRDAGGREMGRALADADGRYSVDVSVGRAVVNVDVTLQFPRCPAREVVVQAGVKVQADIACDTGIR